MSKSCKCKPIVTSHKTLSFYPPIEGKNCLLQNFIVDKNPHFLIIKRELLFSFINIF